jgi:hypothetical protein
VRYIASMTESLFGGELTEAPNAKYTKFFSKFSEINGLPLKSWKPVHVLAYFCKKYKEEYSIDYQFKYNTPDPSKCFEIFQIKRIANTLSSKPEILIPFIDWVFANKVKNAKRRLTSIAFLSHEEVTSEYKTKVLFSARSREISRTDPLPETIQSIFPELASYADLCFMSLVSPMPDELKDRFARLSSIIDLESLKRIK